MRCFIRFPPEQFGDPEPRRHRERSEATQGSAHSEVVAPLDCFASLARTERGDPEPFTRKEYHTLAGCCADLMVGGKSADRSKHAWRQVYRALDHNAARSACKNSSDLDKFPKPIEDFGNTFVTMQSKRHDADDDPFQSYTRSGVLQDIDNFEQAINGFVIADIKDRRAFAALVLFKQRRS